MKDIYPVKPPLNLIFFNENILPISIILSILLLLIFFTLKWYFSSLSASDDALRQIKTLKDKFLDTIWSLDHMDPDFAKRLNFLLRSFLDEYRIIPWVLKMTKNEMLKNMQSKKLLEDFADECESAEFSSKKLHPEESEELKNKALYIINNI
ncbi:MAG: hypothetical protein ACD_2C00005G0008 [uncultured bacterium (gcode 4)]|uniref:Uncharacterized protein n=1 Tax=uncultured bacterium (gcode 4) TaxID=1234023 RepID=K2G4Z2_9BACT|nr:MAG: hypothetical protein ACD_2C00005G0008 [uncultured bacterium (gcode 4)]